MKLVIYLREGVMGEVICKLVVVEDIIVDVCIMLMNVWVKGGVWKVLVEEWLVGLMIIIDDIEVRLLEVSMV